MAEQAKHNQSDFKYLQDGARDAGASFADFCELIAQLRAPGGCPWDAKQTHASIAPNMIEEAYEAVDAIETRDKAGLKEELGDVLLQVVLQAQIACEGQEFDIADVIEGVHEKIVRRHPHVFGDAHVESADETLNLWAKIKREEKARAAKVADENARQGEAAETLHGGMYIEQAFGLPALKLASDISKKAVAAGFDWEDVGGVLAQLDEETAEFLETQPKTDAATDELGDILFTVVNLGRKYGVDAETALRSTCRKFVARWQVMEALAAEEGRDIDSYSATEQEQFWRRAKEALAQTDKGEA